MAWDKQFEGRPELRGRTERPVTVELFVVLARSERLLTVEQMRKRLKERWRDCPLEEVQGALDTLLDKRLAETTEKKGQFRLRLEVREQMRGVYPD